MPRASSMRGIICTYSGVKFSCLRPSPADVRLVDIAVGLSRKCRFSGHTSRWYSVARHSLQVMQSVKNSGYYEPMPVSYLLEALFHDAAEAYTTDVPTPVKALIADYEEMEAKILVAIYESFGLHSGAARSKSGLICEADHYQYQVERHYLMPTVDWWESTLRRTAAPPPVSSPADDCRDFLATANELLEAFRG